MNKTLIAIDFSINSPSITIKQNNKYKFISFINSWGKSFQDKKILKAMQLPLELKDLKDLDIILYSRTKKVKDYQKDQFQGILDANNLCSIIINEIKKISMSNLIISLEGFSYASKGNSAIDLIMYNSFLRKELLTLSNEIYIFSPSEIKSIVTKGNANKIEMVKCFYTNKLNDKELAKSNFFKWASSHKNICIKNDKIPKPIDDLVDSYFILKKLESHLAKSKVVSSPKSP